MRANQVESETLIVKVQGLERSLQAHQNQVDELVRALERRKQEWQQIVDQACQNYQAHHRHLAEQIQAA